MTKKNKQEALLEKIHQTLADINSNMLKVFWIVAIFAFLYFGLMLHLLLKYIQLKDRHLKNYLIFLGALGLAEVFNFASLDSGFNSLSPSHFCPHQHIPSELIMHTPEPQHLLSSIVINYMIFDKNRINHYQLN